jgi:hypothetical protein
MLESASRVALDFSPHIETIFDSSVGRGSEGEMGVLGGESVGYVRPHVERRDAKGCYLFQLFPGM